MNKEEIAMQLTKEIIRDMEYCYTEVAHIFNHLLENLNLDTKENIEQLQQENKQLKNDNSLMKANLIQVSNKELDLYKEVIEEVREYMKENRTRYIYQDDLREDWWFEDLDVYSELLQLLDKVKEVK